MPQYIHQSLPVNIAIVDVQHMETIILSLTHHNPSLTHNELYINLDPLDHQLLHLQELRTFIISTYSGFGIYQYGEIEETYISIIDEFNQSYSKYIEDVTNFNSNLRKIYYNFLEILFHDILIMSSLPEENDEFEYYYTLTNNELSSITGFALNSSDEVPTMLEFAPSSSNMGNVSTDEEGNF